MPFVSEPRFDNFKESDVIWRYIDFAKFVSMLETGALYFTRSDKLLELDPYEGFFHELVFLEPYKKYENFDTLKEMAKKEHPKYLFVNCWHINEYESDAMWKIYGTKNTGIAIKSTIKRLKDSFEKTEQEIKFKKIDYVNHKKQKTIAEDSFERFGKKGISFKHEDEFRLFHLDPDGLSKDGILVPTLLNLLVEKVYVSPLSHNWFFDLVKAIWKKYGYSEEFVEKSSLYDKPS